MFKAKNGIHKSARVAGPRWKIPQLMPHLQLPIVYAFTPYFQARCRRRVFWNIMATRYRLFHCQFKGTLDGKIQSALSVAYIDPKNHNILTLRNQGDLERLIFRYLRGHGFGGFDLSDQQPQTACFDVPGWHEFRV